jgi:NADPH:quinone reductase
MDPTTVRLIAARGYRPAGDYASRPMRAIQIQEFGGPEVLQLVDLPVPVPSDGQVLIRVTTAGLNFSDTHTRHNRYIAKAELPVVPGGEVVGIREDTGERVVALTGLGGYAEYALAPADRVWPVPDGVDDGTALALVIQGLTAWHLYRTSAALRPGESVVVLAAAGGMGTLLCQLGHAMGAGRVIAVASTEEKRAVALGLGADVAVDAAPEGLGARLVAANDGREVDVVFEVVGGQVFDECLAVTAPFGRCVTYGNMTYEQSEIRTGALLKTSRAVVGFWLMHLFDRPEMVAEAYADLFARVARGELRAHVGATYALSDAAQAQIDIAERRTTGKVLLDPGR